MKAVKHLAIVMCAGALFACNKDEATEGGKGAVVSGDPCEVTLTIANNGGTRTGFTGDDVAGTDYENAVKTLEFYVFDSSGDPDVEVGRVDESTPGNGYKKFTTSTNQKSHKITMAGGTGKKIVAVINMNLGDLGSTDNTYEDLKEKLAKGVYYADGTNGYNAREENRSGGFEMTGEKEFSIAAGSINNSVTINVSRLSSRINAPVFSTSVAGFVDFDDEDLEVIWKDDVADVEGKELTYVNEGYVVINGRAKSDAFFIGNTAGNDRLTKEKTIDAVTYEVPDWAIWNGALAIKPVCRSTFDGDGFYTSTYSGKGAAADWFLNGSTTGEHRVYVYENKPSTITVNQVSGYDPGETYALIVKGTIVVDGDVDNDNDLNATRYWRVDLTRADDYHVFRNASYAITVNKITTPGYGTPKEAEEDNKVIPGTGETAADVIINVSNWRENVYNTEM